MPLVKHKQFSAPAFEVVVDALGKGDYSDLQSAVDGGHKTIFIRNGTYPLSSPISIDNTNVVKKITGESRDGVVFDAGVSSINCFEIFGATVSSTGTVTFTSNSTAVTGVGTTWQADGTVVGDYIQNRANGGGLDRRFFKIIAIASDTSLTIEDPYSGDTGGNQSFAVVSPVEDLLIEGMSIFSEYSLAAHINIVRSRGIRVEDVYCKNKQLNFGRGVYINNSDNVVVEKSRFRTLLNGVECLDFCGNTKILNNDFSYMGRAFQSGLKATGLVLSGNSCDNCRIENRVYSATISNNTLFGALAKIQNVSATGAVISGNTVRDSADANGGIHNQGANAVIVGNHCAGNSAGSGIYNVAANCSIVGNNLFNNVGHGIFQAGQEGSVTGNTCFSNTLDGIHCAQTSTRSIITGNRCQGNSSDGIEIAASANNVVVSNNSVLLNTSSGITDNGTDSQVFHNYSTPATDVARVESLTVGNGLSDSGTATDPEISLDEAIFAEKILSKTEAIDAKTVGVTNLYTVPAGKTAVITKAAVRVSAASAITVPLTAGIGVAAGEDDIFVSDIYTDVLLANDLWHLVSIAKSITVAASDIVKFGVDTAATGTSMTLEVTLFGYEF